MSQPENKAAFDTSVKALAAIAASHPNKDAFAFPAEAISFRDLNDKSTALAKALLDLGLEPKENIALLAQNSIHWLIVQLAVAKAGMVLVPLNTYYKVEDLTYALSHSQSRAIFFTPAFRTNKYLELVREATKQSKSNPTKVIIGGRAEQCLSIDDLIAQGATSSAALPTVEGKDNAAIIYTSGTTGFPKGATLSHHNILNNGFFVGELCNYTEADRICIPVPFYHCFGMVMGNLSATSHGACMVIPAPAFDPAATLQAVQAERCTSLYGVPTMFIAELSVPGFADYDLSSLRTGIMAGSPCPVEVMKQVIERMGMAEVGICYGMTETSPVSTQTRADDSLDRRVSTVGRVGPHLEVKVIDPETGRTVSRGTPGELCTRGYSVMIGYWNQPDKTAEAVDAAHWMHTGDLAVMDSEGYLAITGRIKDMVIRGGENIYPREIEEFLYTHPDILDAQVIGVPDAKYGEELMVWVRLRSGAPELTADVLRAFCAGQLAHYKIPRYVHIVEEFPMTVTGKVRKVEMRERSVELLGL